MLNIHWKKIIFPLALVGFTFSGFSQQNKPIYQGEYDAKTIHFGYFLGVALSNYRIKYKDTFLDQHNITTTGDTIKSVLSAPSMGIKMGGLMNFHLNANFDFRILPTVSIYSRKILVNDDPEFLKTREQAWFELPVLLRYKSMRRGNYRMNMFAGMRAGFETNAINLANKSSINRVPGLRKADLSVEYGAGMEFFRNFFKLAPELHFSHGIRNMAEPNKNGSTTVTPLSILQRLNTHTVTFYLFFE